jgi:hypothetical protein
VLLVLLLIILIVLVRVQRRYPVLIDRVVGAEYPAPLHLQAVAWAGFMAQIASFALMMAGDFIMGAVGYPTGSPRPAWYEWAVENKGKVMIGAFLCVPSRV